MDTKLRAIYRYLKAHQWSFMREIAAGVEIPISIDEVNRYLLLETAKGQIVAKSLKEGEEVRFAVRFVLGSKPPKTPPGTVWEYEKILDAEKEKLATAAPPPAPPPPPPPGSYPDEYHNPYKPVHREQGNAGTCVGQSGAAVMDANYYRLTGKTIQESLGTLILRNQTYGRTIYDVLPGFSAECVYTMSRKTGHVTAPMGSFVRVGVKAMVEYGCCLNDQWYCAKDGLTRWTDPYPATQADVDAFAALHRIDGYARVTTAEALKKAISERKPIWGSIPIYENWMGAGKVGDLIDANLLDGRGECIGWHALYWDGYSEQRLLKHDSWEGWTEEGSISWNYFRQAMDHGADFYVILDAEEAVIGLETYKKVVVVSHPSSEVSHEGTVLGQTPCDLWLEKDKGYTLLFKAAGYIDNTWTGMVDDGLTLISVTLEAVLPPKPPTLLEKIVAFLKWFFNRK